MGCYQSSQNNGINAQPSSAQLLVSLDPSSPMKQASSSVSRPLMKRMDNRCGVSLSFLQHILSLSREDWTTQQVYENVIFAKTKGKRPFTEFFEGKSDDKGNLYLGKPAVLLIHGWNARFSALIGALEQLGVQSQYFWIDFIALNHDELLSSAECPLADMQDFISALGSATCVLSPFDEPLALQRVWCLWEIYSCTAASLPLRFCLPKLEKARFIHAVLENPSKVAQLIISISSVHVEEANSYTLESKEAVFNQIQKSVGFRIVNQEIGARVKQFYIDLLDVIINDEIEARPVDNESARLSTHVGHVLQHLEDYNAALPHYYRSLELHKKLLGPSHLSTSRDLANIGETFLKLSQIEQAMAALAQALSIRASSTTDPSDPDLLKLYRTVGHLYFESQNYKSSIDYFSRIVPYASDEDHELWSALGTSYYQQRDIDRAIDCQTKALSITTRLFSGNNLKIGAAHSNLGTSLIEKQDFSKAMTHLNKALTICLSACGNHSLETLNCYYGIGLCYYQQRNMAQAKTCFEQVSEGYAEHLGENHQMTMAAFRLLELCEDG